MVSDAEKGNWKAGVEFFRAENTVDYLISRLADGNMANGKPCIAQVAIMDGIVMGGGAGLAMHGQFRVATEKYDSNTPQSCRDTFSTCCLCAPYVHFHFQVSVYRLVPQRCCLKISVDVG